MFDSSLDVSARMNNSIKHCVSGTAASAEANAARTLRSQQCCEADGTLDRHADLDEATRQA